MTLQIKLISLGAKEQMSEEFLKMNPLHKVPVLKDGDYILTGKLVAYFSILLKKLNAHKFKNPERLLLI